MLKFILKQLIPPFFITIIKNLYFKIGKTKYFLSSIHEHMKKSDTILILGNGPSLKQQLDNNISILSSYPLICVNHFVSTSYYCKIKPSIYVLADPNLFLENPPPSLFEVNENMWKNLYELTSWKIEIIIPSQFKDNYRIKYISKNNYIKILFYNNMIDLIDYKNKDTQFKYFNKNKLKTPAQTVLNTAVFLAIFWKYKNIVLLGADTSWHKELNIDQDTNKLYIYDEHFYDNKKRFIYKDMEETIPIKLHEEFRAICIALENYWLLRDYAKYNSVTVYNASSVSWIDAFERISLDKFFCNIEKPLNQSINNEN